MASKRFLLVILAIALVFGLTVVSCGDDGGNTEPKTIVITGLTGNWGYGEIILIPAGTPVADFDNGKVGVVARAYWDNDDVLVASSSVTYPLHNNPGDFSSSRWTGSGTYDVWWWYNPNYTGTVWCYIASSVSFTSAITTVPVSRFSRP